MRLERFEGYVRINITRFLSVTYLTPSARAQTHERRPTYV